MADLEDALKKLDRLTQEEARMALAEVLGIADNILDEVKGVDSKVERVEDKVEDIGGKVQVVVDGARALSSRPLIASDMYSFRRQASKRRGEGSKIDSSTDRKPHRRNGVFVTS